jgi:hypothetical protein
VFNGRAGTVRDDYAICFDLVEGLEVCIEKGRDGIAGCLRSCRTVLIREGLRIRVYKRLRLEECSEYIVR